MSCNALLPNGSARKACVSKQVTNLIFLEFGIEFNNYLAAENVENWRGLIQKI